jgi:alpha-L-arabinofuranosidase
MHSLDMLGGYSLCAVRQTAVQEIQSKKYIGRIAIASAPEAAPVEVSLVSDNGEGFRAVAVIDRIAADFVTYSLSFTPGASTDNGRLEIVGRGKGFFEIGAVSLMPSDNIRGMRADTLDLLKPLNSPVYRWPGGDFASGYEWRDGLGERDGRPPRKNPPWTGVESNDFGIHGYMDFCREIGADPYLVINAGRGDARSAADEVEYLNGSANAPMGKLRAAHRHPEPFNAKPLSVSLYSLDVK